MIKSFQDLNLNPELQRALTEMGFEKPSPIQEQALPLLTRADVSDFIGLAATGTGKTAAFSIPMLAGLDRQSRAVQALILCPTRELAQQVAGQITLMGKYLGTKVTAIYGGASFGDQIHSLKRQPSVVVGTPGRVVDHLERGTLKLDQVQTLILDEADEMISMGFKDDLEFILKAIRGEAGDDLTAAPRAKTWLFSATMSPEVRRVADTYLENPKQVQVNRQEMVPASVEQRYFITQESNKPEVLCKLIDAASEFYGIVFCQTKSLVADLTDYLKGRGYPVDCLHGDMDQSARERVMRAFRERRITVLVATDVACRGLDVKDISHVVNYSLPREMDNYVHRIGRTGRVGKTGFAYNLVTGSHRGLIGRIEKVTKSRMLEGRIPSRKEIGAKKVAGLLGQFNEQSAHAKAIELMSTEWKQMLEGLSKEEIAGRFLVLLNPELFGERKKDERPAAPSPITPITPIASGPAVIQTASQQDLKNDRRVEHRPHHRIRKSPIPVGAKPHWSGEGEAPRPFTSRGRKPAWSPNGGRKAAGAGGFHGGGNKKPWGQKRVGGSKKPFGRDKRSAHS